MRHQLKPLFDRVVIKELDPVSTYDYHYIFDVFNF
jgi:hypothetical protein